MASGQGQRTPKPVGSARRRNDEVASSVPTNPETTKLVEGRPMAASVAERLLDVLAEAGVRRVYGVPGDAVNVIVDGLRRDDRIDFVGVRHEETGAFAASAAAKLTGELTAVVGTAGPGAIHLLNGLFDAKL